MCFDTLERVNTLKILTPLKLSGTLFESSPRRHKPGGFVLTVLELLEIAHSRISRPTDYRLSRDLGISQATIISWRKGKTKPETLTMARLAAVCGVDPKQALLWLQIERSKTDSERELWESVAQAMAVPCVTIEASSPDESPPSKRQNVSCRAGAKKPASPRQCWFPGAGVI